MASTTFRPRTLNIHEKMTVFNEDVSKLREHNRRSSISRSVRSNGSGMEKEEESEKHLQEAMVDQSIPIPIPGCYFVSDYEKESKKLKPFFLPRKYVEYDESFPSFYDMDDEDEDYLSELNQNGEVLSDTRFEFLIERFEKEADILEETPSLSHLSTLFTAMPADLLESVYSHWLKRRANGRPLVPHVLRPDSNNKSPYLAFRPRQTKMKKSKHNDPSIYLQLWQLRQEMEKARTLLEMIRKREKLKLDRVTTISKAFDLETGRITPSDLSNEDKLFDFDIVEETPAPATPIATTVALVTEPMSPEEPSIEGDELTENRAVAQSDPVPSPSKRKHGKRMPPAQDTERSFEQKKTILSPITLRGGKRVRDTTPTLTPKSQNNTKRFRSTPSKSIQ